MNKTPTVVADAEHRVALRVADRFSFIDDLLNGADHPPSGPFLVYRAPLSGEVVFIPIDSLTMTIGRDDKNDFPETGSDVVIRNCPGYISGRHLIIHCLDDEIVLEDVSRGNQTYLNDAGAVRFRHLVPGDIISIGAMEGHVDLAFLTPL